MPASSNTHSFMGDPSTDADTPDEQSNRIKSHSNALVFGDDVNALNVAPLSDVDPENEYP